MLDLQSGAGEINWIIETKGRVWEGTELKDEALKTWCEHVSGVTGQCWKYTRINQLDFDQSAAVTLEELLFSALPGTDFR